MQLTFVFGVLSSITALIAYGFYFRQILNGSSTPNPVSWAIWVIAGLINAVTYFLLTNGNIWQSLLVLSVLASTTLIFLYSLFKGKFTKITKFEALLFLLALLVGIFWQATSDSRTANLLLQVVYVISFIPTILGVAYGIAKENVTSWSIVLLAYFFSLLSVIFGVHTDWIAFVNPLVNGLLCTGITVGVIFYNNVND